MGFYFSKPTQQHFEAKHKTAIATFSYITIAYQLFFISWLSAMTKQVWLLPLAITLGLVIHITKNRMSYWAVAILVVCLGLFIGFMGNTLAPINISAKSDWPHALLPLAIGFIFSPYLDITFHRAFKNSTHPKASFSLGFGLLFLILLSFVFLYASSLSELFFNGAGVSEIPSAIIYPIVAFLVLQTAFTVAAHSSELALQHYIRPALLGYVVLALSVFFIALTWQLHGVSLSGLNLPFEETVYKGFLFFYSLVFPLYLLLGKSKPIFLWVLGLSTPAYALGFLIGDNYSVNLSVGVTVVVLGSIIGRRHIFSKV